MYRFLSMLLLGLGSVGAPANADVNPIPFMRCNEANGVPVLVFHGVVDSDRKLTITSIEHHLSGHTRVFTPTQQDIEVGEAGLVSLSLRSSDAGSHVFLGLDFRMSLKLAPFLYLGEAAYLTESSVTNQQLLKCIDFYGTFLPRT